MEEPARLSIIPVFKVVISGYSRRNDAPTLQISYFVREADAINHCTQHVRGRREYDDGLGRLPHIQHEYAVFDHATGNYFCLGAPLELRSVAELKEGTKYVAPQRRE